MTAFTGVYSATVTTSTPVTLEIPNSGGYKEYFISATGAGTLQIETKAGEQSAFTTDLSISGEKVIVEFTNVSEIKLTASGSNVPVYIFGKNRRID